MDKNRILGLYVAYYLARYNKKAYEDLGFGNMLETHNKIAEILSLKPNTIKNWRDEFDPLFGHRQGWHSRPMSKSRLIIVDELKDLSDEAIKSIVYKILNDKISYAETIALESVSENEESYERAAGRRGITGRKAEEYFIENHLFIEAIPKGKLIDKRDHACGYDFEIEGDKTYFVEIKGLSGKNGGILFTDKEWESAKKHENNYILCLFKNLDENPTYKIVINPYNQLDAEMNIQTVLQVTWSVKNKELQL